MNKYLRRFRTPLSSVSLALVVTLITIFTTHYLNTKTLNIEFEQTYYKMIIEKRFNAIEQVYVLLEGFGSSIIDPDTSNRYHLIFRTRNFQSQYYNTLVMLAKYEVWLMPKTMKSIRRLQNFISFERIDINRKDHGLKYFERLEKLVTDIEASVKVELGAMSRKDKYFEYLNKK
ncbi:hypothetical protein HOG98_07070 [bacterium]|jgi:hypothetical protein|nr:hypothetical protein [bacterium]